MLQLSLKTSWALLIEYQHGSVLTVTFTTCEDEVKGLGCQVLALKLDTCGEAEKPYALYEWLVGTVFRWVSVENFWSEPCL